MTGQTYVYLIAAAVFLIWAVAMAVVAINVSRKNRKLTKENANLGHEAEDLRWHLKRQGDEIKELNDLMDGRSTRRKKTATNTDYLIEEEEYA